MTKKLTYNLSILALAALLISGCGPSQFTQGKYDEDINRENNLNDSWSETDMQKAVNQLIASAGGSAAVRKAAKPPIVMVTGLQNKTSEHIDTQSIMDMMKVELTNAGQLQFVDKEAREDIAGEYEYQESGMVSRETKKGKGGQIGADYIMNGRLDSIVQQVGKDKSVYYKLTLNLTNLKTGIIEWTDHKQIRKTYKKKSVGI
jgi:uncharacterized protein (TIGR02722 family)